MKKALLVTLAVALAICLSVGAASAVGSSGLTVKLNMNVPGTTVTDFYGETTYVSGYYYEMSYHSGTLTPPKDGYFTVSKPGYQTKSVYVSAEYPEEGKTVIVSKNVDLQEVPAGTLYITSNPSDASVRVDGSYVGTTPITLTVSPGTHSISISKNGYTTTSTTARVYSGDTTSVSVTLGSSSGYISISCDPAGASVYLDQEYIGTAPITVKASAGKHTVEMKKSGYGSFSSSVTVRAGETSAVYGVLPQSVSSGYFSISSTPTGASVYVDGEYIGKTPYSASGVAYLTAGPYSSSRTYTVKLELDGYQTYTTTAVPNAGSTVVISPTLSKEQATTGTLHVTSSPAGAAVTVDGTYYGTTPVTIPKLSAGSHSVKVSATGYVDSIQTVQVNAGQYVEYPVTLYTPSPAQSPAPVLGALIGLAAAGLLVGLRRRQ